MKKKHQKLVTKQMKRLSVVNAHRAILIDKLDSIKEEPEQEAKNTPRDNGINGSQEPQLLQAKILRHPDEKSSQVIPLVENIIPAQPGRGGVRFNFGHHNLYQAFTEDADVLNRQKYNYLLSTKIKRKEASEGKIEEEVAPSRALSAAS